MTRRIAGFRATAKLLTVLFDIFQGLAQKVRVVNYLRIYLRNVLKLGREICAFWNDQLNNDNSYNVMHILKTCQLLALFAGLLFATRAVGWTDARGRHWVSGYWGWRSWWRRGSARRQWEDWKWGSGEQTFISKLSLNYFDRLQCYVIFFMITILSGIWKHCFAFRWKDWRRTRKTLTKAINPTSNRRTMPLKCLTTSMGKFMIWRKTVTNKHFAGEKWLLNQICYIYWQTRKQFLENWILSCNFGMAFDVICALFQIMFALNVNIIGTYWFWLIVCGFKN